MQVVDASAVIDAVIPAGRLGELAAEELNGQANIAPELLDVEVVHALRGLVRRREFSERAARLTLRAVESIGITRRPHVPLVPRMWELRDNLTAYDAAYVALAEALNCPLVTADARIAAAPGVRCEVHLLGA